MRLNDEGGTEETYDGGVEDVLAHLVFWEKLEESSWVDGDCGGAMTELNGVSILGW